MRYEALKIGQVSGSSSITKSTSREGKISDISSRNYCLLTEQLTACESRKKSLEEDKQQEMFHISLRYLKQTYILKIAEVAN